MSGLPAQLPGRRFVCVLRKLGYSPLAAKRGSLRSFSNPTRNPKTISFREPHPSDMLRPARLREYLHKLALSPEEFLRLLEDC
jgi:predicted RNA binding protein YcfA (HicA-like mRNA interferase family)